MTVRSQRLGAMVAAAFVLTVGIVSAAVGDPATDPCGTVSSTAGGAAGSNCDNEVTPQAKRPDQWTAVGGAKFDPNGSGGLVDHSMTPFTVNFYTVAFETDDHGFAGGAACDPGTAWNDLDTCTRYPVIWEYSVTATGPQWSEIYRGTTPGYVGALAFKTDGTALAVGGDTSPSKDFPNAGYPRRELEPSGLQDDLAQDDLDHGAGRARAWSYDGSAWTEVANPGQAAGNDAPPMHGLAALDCSPRATDGDFCVAGGFQQLWMWQNGHFAKYFTPTSQNGTSPTQADRSDWHFRVRDVRFVPGNLNPTDPQVVAVTSGCCGATPTNDNAPRLLVYQNNNWFSRLLANEWVVSNANGGTTVRNALPPGSIPDSYYSALVSNVPNRGRRVSVLATPGAQTSHYPAGEPATRLIDAFMEGSSLNSGLGVGVLFGVGQNGGTGGFSSSGNGNTDATGNLTSEATNPNLGDVRLMSGDGDYTAPQQDPGIYQLLSTQDPSYPAGSPDGLMDWSVGELRSTGEAAAYTTLENETTTPNPLNCPGDAGVQNNQGALTNCSVRAPADSVAQTKSQRLLALDTYALNAFRFTPGGGFGWAVGDKGAIERLGASAAAVGAEPNPPALGAHQTGTASDTQAYDGFRPVGAPPQPGTVPSVFSQPQEQLSSPRFVPAGSPDPSRPKDLPTEGVSSMAMSRDGAEGWAVGPGDTSGAKGEITLYHYVGGRWIRCGTQGGPTGSDPACSSLAQLIAARNSSGAPLVQLTSIARIPMENGSDPSKADDFEAIAVGTIYRLPGETGDTALVLRYQDGRWSMDENGMKQIASPVTLGQVAFTSPDDGWIVSDSTTVPALYHYNGDGWINCTPGSAACGDTDSQNPLPLQAGDSLPRVATVGKRIYLAGARSGSRGGLNVSNPSGANDPVILHKDPGQPWTVDKLSPASGDPSVKVAKFTNISVWQRSDGKYVGWASGLFGNGQPGTSTAPLLRLSDDEWTRWTTGDAANDYLTPENVGGSQLPGAPGPVGVQLLALAGANGGPQAFAIPFGATADPNQGVPLEPLIDFSTRRGKWAVAPTPFSLIRRANSPDGESSTASVQAMATDNQGGFWLAAKQVIQPQPDSLGRSPKKSDFFYHYTDHVPKPLFQEVPEPVREPMTGMTTGADGSVWVTTASSNVYRYDRLTGWDRINIPGWDPGNASSITRQSEANAVAVGPDGKGVIVGRQGRIANVGPGRGVLDAVAGSAAGHCPSSGGCGTSRDLRAAAVASDGSAMTGGDDRALLWRPSGGDFRPVNAPVVPPSATFNGVAFSDPQHAWLITDTGRVFAGELAGGDWQWRLEDVDESGHLLTRSGPEGVEPLRAIALDSSGAGYAVGDRGVILQRDPSGGAHPWRRLNTGYLDNLDSVALPPGGGPGALIGGDVGLVLTLQNGRWETARPADFYDPLINGVGDALSAKTVGVAVLPGDKEGQVEAWAATQAPTTSVNFSRRGPGAMLHYTNAPDDPLLDGGVHRANPLPDTSAPQAGEVAFASFGKSECQLAANCPEPQGSNLFNDVIASRIVDAIAARAHDMPGATVAVFTGDVDRASGSDLGSPDLLGHPADTPIDPSVIHNRWRELVADRLAAANVPVFGAIGNQDLSQLQDCQGTSCPSTRQATGAGLSLPWRQAFADMPAPWGQRGNDAPASQGSWSFHAVSASDTEAPDGGKAHTHYAVDIEHDGQPVVRLVVVDSALKSVTGPGSVGNPVEEQDTWMNTVLSNRQSGERAVVVSETPSYSVGPGATSDTLTDQAPFETQMLTNKVSAVISGRLGWNAVYDTCAPGLHDPDPSANGSPYPNPNNSEKAPCELTSSPTSQVPPEAQQAAQAIEPLAPAPVQPLLASGQTGLTPVPNVIAASAGGKFGPNGNSSGSASQGFWHGYSLVRLEPNGAVIVDQRPIFDWVGIRAQNNTLLPGQHMTLKGFGREAMSTDQPAQYDDINSPAITHRYDLVEADPQHPWLPKIDESNGEPNHYVPLDSSVASIDRQSGAISTGRGSHPRVYGLGIMSVGDQVATWPVVFEPRKNFRQPPAPIVLPAAQLPPLHVAAAPATSLPAAPPPPPPQVGTPGMPQVPPLPNLPPVASAPPPAAPPPPPAPPPPSFGQPLPLSLSPQPTPVSVLGTVVPPSPPPVNPAPPSGSAAKKEARQRQAAAAKSEEGASESADPGEAQGRQDSVETPNVSMSRLDHSNHHPFTARARDSQPSAWARDAIAGGGLTVMALVLALGWTALRPTPRRREPTIPAPAWARNNRRRR